MLRMFGLLAAALVAASAETLGATWPEEPVGKTVHARLLAESAGPSGNDIAQYNIIVFSSIGLVVSFYFAIMVMVNMDDTSDSLLYAKAKGE